MIQRFSNRVVPAAFTIAAVLGLNTTSTLAGVADVENDAEAYYTCSAYLMADLHYFDYHNGDADMDLAFEEAVTSFVIAAHETQWSWKAEEIDILRYKEELVSFMLVFFLMMERQDSDPDAKADLASVQKLCAELGAKHEETRWVFQ